MVQEKLDPKAAKMANRKQYVLMRGTHDGIDEDGDRQLYEAGQLVWLTPKQYLAFQDKFTTPAVYHAQAQARKAQIAAANEATAATADVAAENESVRKKAEAEVAKVATTATAAHPPAPAGGVVETKAAKPAEPSGPSGSGAALPAGT